jgi:hypothetical protein
MYFVVFVSFGGGISLSWLLIVSSSPLCGPFFRGPFRWYERDSSVLKEVFSGVCVRACACLCVSRTKESTLLKNQSAVDQRVK